MPLSQHKEMIVLSFDQQQHSDFSVSSIDTFWVVSTFSLVVSRVGLTTFLDDERFEGLLLRSCFSFLDFLGDNDADDSL